MGLAFPRASPGQLHVGTGQILSPCFATRGAASGSASLTAGLTSSSAFKSFADCCHHEQICLGKFRICQAELTHSTVLTACCCLGAQRGGQPWHQGWHFGKVWAGFCSPVCTVQATQGLPWGLQEPRVHFPAGGTCSSQGISSSATAQPKQGAPRRWHLPGPGWAVTTAGRP